PTSSEPDAPARALAGGKTGRCPAGSGEMARPLSFLHPLCGPARSARALLLPVRGGARAVCAQVAGLGRAPVRARLAAEGAKLGDHSSASSTPAERLVSRSNSSTSR